MTARTVGLISEIEVINSVLSVAGDAPIQSLDDTYQPVYIIRDIMSNISRDMQTKGYWFNKETGVTLSPSAATNTIVLPFNTLSMEAVDKSYVMRGLTVYDRTNRTKTITSDITADLVLMLEFDELPQIAREYIRAASRVQYNNEYYGETNFKQELMADFQKAKTALERESLENEQLNIFSAQAITNIAFKNRRR